MINWLLHLGVFSSIAYAAHHCFLPIAATDKKTYFHSLLLFAEPSETLLELYERLDNPTNVVSIKEIPEDSKRKVFELASWTGNTVIMKLLLDSGDADYDLLGAIQIVADRLSLDQYNQGHWSSALKFLISKTPNVWLFELENIIVQYIGQKCFGAVEILQVMMDDIRFPVVNSKSSMSLGWYQALVKLIQHGNYVMFRTIISDWKLFKTRIRLSMIPPNRRELIVEALTLKRPDMVFLLATRFWIFQSLRPLSQGPHRRKLLKIIPTLKEFDWTGIEQNKESVLVKFLDSLYNQYPYHIDVQAALLGSSTLSIDKEEYVSNAIKSGLFSHVLGAMKAGCLQYRHLTTIHEAGRFESIYDQIDEHFGHVNPSTLQYKGEGRALLFLIDNIGSSTIRSRMLLESLLPEISWLGPMKVLQKLEAARTAGNRELGLRSKLTTKQWILFQTCPWEIDNGDLVYSTYRRLAEFKSGDMLNMEQMRPSILFTLMNHASTDKDYLLVSRLSSIIAKRFTST